MELLRIAAPQASSAFSLPMELFVACTALMPSRLHQQQQGPHLNACRNKDWVPMNPHVTR